MKIIFTIALIIITKLSWGTFSFLTIHLSELKTDKKDTVIYLNIENTINAKIFLNRKEIIANSISLYPIFKDSLLKENDLLIQCTGYKNKHLDIDQIFKKYDSGSYIGIKLIGNNDSIYFLQGSEFPYKSTPEKLVLLNNCDTLKIEEAIKGLGVIIEKRYNYCNDRSMDKSCLYDTYILRKKNNSLFDRKNCSELEKLRGLFINTNVSVGPLLIKNNYDFVLLNTLEIGWSKNVPEKRQTEILNSLGLEKYSIYYKESYMMIIKVSDAIGEGIIDIARQLQKYKEISFVSNQLNSLICVTGK